MDIEPPYTPKDTVGLKIKIPIVLLTLVTLGVLIAVFVRLFTGPMFKGKNETPGIVSGSASDAWIDQLKGVGDRLRELKLYEQAIDQYVRYLDRAKLDKKSRAEISLAIGEIYIQLSNCNEALPWLLQAEASGAISDKAGLNKNIDLCMSRVRKQRAEP
ncbi:MAG: hypothetical protein COV67_04295 [Nitrospinae bacterium CG11_big_fil_rev_8_21_14_0_20_56_8]|nr:MAG: hypothetical protein COV67_04295 [Nitrospinae bacterium CG11_big_fil_rev_8_21_14_0_20_56_8]